MWVWMGACVWRGGVGSARVWVWMGAFVWGGGLEVLMCVGVDGCLCVCLCVSDRLSVRVCVCLYVSVFMRMLVYSPLRVCTLYLYIRMDDSTQSQAPNDF